MLCPRGTVLSLTETETAGSTGVSGGWVGGFVSVGSVGGGLVGGGSVGGGLVGGGSVGGGFVGGGFDGGGEFEDEEPPPPPPHPARQSSTIATNDRNERAEKNTRAIFLFFSEQAYVTKSEEAIPS